MEYNINFGQINPFPVSSQPSASLPLYASVDGRAASLSADECVFQTRRGGELHVMTHQVLQALDKCREFRTLDEHVARVTALMPGLSGQGDAVRRVLTGMIDRGVIVSDQTFLDGLVASGDSSPPALTALTIRACDRPQQLTALMDSLKAHAVRHGRRDRIVLLDDSRAAAAVQAHRAALNDYASATGASVIHLDAQAAADRVQRLIKARPEAADTLQALRQPASASGFGGGRGYNLALLLTAGQRLCMLDDDYQLPFHRATGAVPGLEPSPWQSFDNHFQSTLAQSLAAGEELPDDGIAIQQDLVGHHLGEVIAHRPELRLDREQLRGQTLARLDHLHGDARVLATYTGTRGASFTSDSLWLFRQADASRDRFRADRDSYLRNIHAETMEFAPSRTITRPYGLFTPFMLDNSRLLPCTANSGRGEDGLFGISANWLYPDTLTLHLPITIGHVQEGKRHRFDRAMRPLTPGINRFLREWMLNQAQPARGSNPVDRLAFLAAQLEDLAGAPTADLVESLQEYLRYVRADLIEALQQQLLAEPDAPVYWAADLRRIVEVNGRALLASDASPRLDEWPEDIDAAGCAELLRQACRQLARDYRHWPAVWQTAAEMGGSLAGWR